MKRLIKIILLLGLVAALSIGASYLFLVFKGKQIIIDALQEVTQREVSIGSFGLTPTLSFQIKNLRVKDVVQIETVYFSPSIGILLSGNLGFNVLKLIKPKVSIERFPQEKAASKIAFPQPAESLPFKAMRKKASFWRKKPTIIVNRLKVKDGAIIFIDYTFGDQALRIEVKDVNIYLRHYFSRPRSVITIFDVQGKIPWETMKEVGTVEIKGWADFLKKDMRATIKISNIDGVFLCPYYRAWIDLEKARIERARLNFVSDINSLANDLTAQCSLTLTDIAFKPESPGGEVHKEEKIATTVLDMFKSSNAEGKVELKFVFKTTMDRPEFGLKIIQGVVEEELKAVRGKGPGIQDVVLLPAKICENTFQGTSEITKAIIAGVVTVAAGIGKVFFSAFKKEPEKEE